MADHDDEGSGAHTNLRILPTWIQHELCNRRLAAYRKEIRGGLESRSRCNLAPFGTEDRPYGIPWEWQGAVVDIWSLVFAFITDPKDIINLCETSDLFRDMLKRKYVQARFPEILDIYLSRPHLGELLVPDEDVRLTTSFMKLFLKLRLLSKLTKRSAEDYVYALDNPEEVDIQSHWLIDEIIPGLCVVTNENIHQLLNLQSSDGTGAVFPNCLVITDIFMINPEQEIEILLQRIGHGIQTIIYEASMIDPRSAYIRLLLWLQQTPNLETLKILASPHFANVIQAEEDQDQELEIPEFITLEKLKIYGDDVSFPDEFREKILKANLTIRFVTQENRFYHRSNNGPLPIRTEVLEHLLLEQYMFMSTPPLSFYQLEFQWPLKKLSLADTQPFNIGENNIVGSKVLFGFLNQFWRTLKELHVELKVKDNGGYLELPNLQSFSWRLQRKCESVDFMIPLEALQSFHCYIGSVVYPSPFIFTVEDIDKPREEILQFYQGWRNKSFKGTNMKLFFPRLKKIEFHWD